MNKTWSIIKKKDGQWCLDDVALLPLAAEFGTPLYIYSAEYIRMRYRNYYAHSTTENLSLHYAVKANNNISVLRLLAQEGAGFDIVSRGELEKVILAGGSPENIVFSGVGKTDAEIHRALEVGIGCFNVESQAELHRLAEIATQAGKIARIALRVNPDVDAQTHPYISTGMRENKFGIALELAPALYRWAQQQPCLRIIGVGCHIGSQITSLSPFLAATDSVLALAEQLSQEGIPIKHIDMGGGLGIAGIQQPDVPSPEALMKVLSEKVIGSGYHLYIQPGRSVVGNAGILLTKVIYTKHQLGRNFLIVDAAMNDYIRPALYQAMPFMQNLNNEESVNKEKCDVVGPVCESSDTFAKEYSIAGKRGDIIALSGVGAYGFAMSSTYNTRPRAAEVLIDGGQARLIRRRENLADLWAQELGL